MKKSIIIYVLIYFIGVLSCFIILNVFTKNNDIIIQEVSNSISDTNKTVVEHNVIVTNINDKIIISNIINTSNDYIITENIIKTPLRKHLYGLGIGLTTDIYAVFGFSYIYKSSHSVDIDIKMSLTNYKDTDIMLKYTKYW